MAMWPVLANQAAAGCLSGMYNGRQYANGPTGAPLLPTDQVVHSTCANAFGKAFDAALLLLFTADGSAPAGLGSAGGIIESEETNLGTTQETSQLTTAAETNVALSYPAAVYGLCKAIMDGRGLPKNASGVAFALADWEADGVPAVAAAEFYEWIKTGVVSLA